MFSSPIKTFFLHTCVIIATVLILLYGYSTTIWNDISLYKNYANNFWHGSTTSSKLPKEYPILSLVPMVLPSITGDALYDSTFTFILLIITCGIYLFLYYSSSKKSAFAYLIFIILGGFGLVLSRLDLIVGMLILFSLYEANKKKFISAYIFLALGTMLKFTPFILIIPLFLEEQMIYRHQKNLKKFYGIASFLAICITLFSLSLLIDTHAAISPFRYGINRPIQLESIPASILYTLSLTGMLQTCTGMDFGSTNIYLSAAGVCNPPQNALANLLNQEILLILMICLIYGVIFVSKLLLSKKMTISQAYIAILFLLLSTNKVFSPQYILWILPIVAYIHRFDRKIFTLTVLIAALTTFFFPILGASTIISFSKLDQLQVILLRNIIFVSVTIAYLFNIGKLRQNKS